MKKCPYCDASIYFDNTAYCPECGKPLNTAGGKKKAEEQKRPQSVPVGIVSSGLDPASSAPKPYKPNMPAPIKVQPIEAFVLKGSHSSLFANAFNQTGMVPTGRTGATPSPKTQPKAASAAGTQSSSRFFSDVQASAPKPTKETASAPKKQERPTEKNVQPSKKVSTSGFFDSKPEKTVQSKKPEKTVQPAKHAEPRKARSDEKIASAPNKSNDAFQDILAADKKKADEKKRYEDEFQDSETAEPEKDAASKNAKEDEPIKHNDYDDSYDGSEEYDDADDDDEDESEYDDADDDDEDEEDEEDYDDAYDAKEAKRRQRQLDKAIRAKEGFDPNRHIGLFFFLTVLCPLLMPILILLSLKRPRRIRYVLTGFILGLFVWFTVGLILFANPPLLTKTDAMLAQHLPVPIHNILRAIYNAVPYSRIKAFFTGVSKRGL